MVCSSGPNSDILDGKSSESRDQKKNYKKWLIMAYVPKKYMWKPLWQARQRMEKELEAPSTTASRLGGTRDSRSGSRARGGGRGSYRGGASRIARSRSRRGEEEE